VESGRQSVVETCVLCNAAVRPEKAEPSGGLERLLPCRGSIAKRTKVVTTTTSTTTTTRGRHFNHLSLILTDSRTCFLVGFHSPMTTVTLRDGLDGRGCW
jgi:hypothetical protein